jgi:hypothetical protein
VAEVDRALPVVGAQPGHRRALETIQ